MFELTMRRIARRKVSPGHRAAGPAPRRACPRIEALEARLVLSSSPTPYLQTNLVSDIPGLAQIQDSSLVNPWGVSFSSASPNSPISEPGDQYQHPLLGDSHGHHQRAPDGQHPDDRIRAQGPTGQVSNNHFGLPTAQRHAGALHLRQLERHDLRLERRHERHAGSDDPKGQLHGPGPHRDEHRGVDFLYAANDAGTIDVFDGKFAPHSFGPGLAFVDPELPSGLVPFNVQFINGDLYVTYAPPDTPLPDDATPGQGARGGVHDQWAIPQPTERQQSPRGAWGIAAWPRPASARSPAATCSSATSPSMTASSTPSIRRPGPSAARSPTPAATPSKIPGAGPADFGGGRRVGGDPNTLLLHRGHRRPDARPVPARCRPSRRSRPRRRSCRTCPMARSRP